MGFDVWAFMPWSRHFWISSSKASALTAMMGMVSVSALCSCGAPQIMEPDEGGDGKEDVELTLWTFPVGTGRLP